MTQEGLCNKAGEELSPSLGWVPGWLCGLLNTSSVMRMVISLFWAASL